MSNVMTARQIAENWLVWVEQNFLLSEGTMRAQVAAEWQRLSETNSIREERPLWRSYTDQIIGHILDCPLEARGKLLDAIDARALAFVQDRIQSGTELLTGLVHQELSLKVAQGPQALPEFFRQLLLQHAAVPPGEDGAAAGPDREPQEVGT